jgi:hypothetical protein
LFYTSIKRVGKEANTHNDLSSYAATTVLTASTFPEARADAHTLASGHVTLTGAAVLAGRARLRDAIAFTVRLKARGTFAINRSG